MMVSYQKHVNLNLTPVEISCERRIGQAKNQSRQARKYHSKSGIYAGYARLFAQARMSHLSQKMIRKHGQANREMPSGLFPREKPVYGSIQVMRLDEKGRFRYG
jgi:hypothetical protein